MCASGMSSRCKIPAVISYQSRDGRAMAGVMSSYLTAAGPSVGRKRKGKTPKGGFGTSSTVSCSS